MLALVLAAAVEAVSLVPGFRLSGTFSFERPPTGMNTLVEKGGEYLLRYDAEKDGTKGAFRFWPYVNGKWESSIGVEMTVEPGRKYAVVATWDGTEESISVNGVRAHKARFGTCEPNDRPVRVGARAKAEDLDIRITGEPTAFLTGIRTGERLPRVGERMTILADVWNVGVALTNGRVTATTQRGATIEPAETRLAALASDASVPLRWTLDPGELRSPYVTLTLWNGTNELHRRLVDLVQMPHRDPDLSAAKWNPTIRPTRTYHIDSRAGDDARDGLSPATAWKTFARTKGLVLGPGERLLLRRGAVFGEELVVTAKGAADNWSEIGAYGEGPRPTIRRTRDIDDRCAFVSDPAYLAIRDLVVCDAGKGFIVECGASGSGHVLMERCLAHHIEGLYRFNSHGIPEWRDRKGAPGGTKGGLVLCGQWANHTVMRDCEMYQCSNGFAGLGSDVWFGRLLCHDNTCRNTSPHPFFTATRRAWFVDSVFDGAGWNASSGTMGIMFGHNDGMVVRGCHFLNMADSGSGDAGGIDFECYGNNCLVEGCTFRNNAGAAIEVLGFSTEQAHNTQILGCRFERNNWAHKSGPAEILIDGGGTTSPSRTDRRIWNANGFIEGNGYVLAPGVAFFTNKSELTQANWTLRDNVRYADWEALRRAMPLADPPEIAAGDEIWTDAAEAELKATVRSTTKAVVAWERLEGPADVAYAAPDAATTRVSLPAVGDYRFLVKADDGRYWRTARTAVHRLSAGTRAVRAWTFARNLDAEGWTFDGLGIEKETFYNPYTFAEPVHDVVGDYFVLAMKDASAARLLSAAGLGLETGADAALLIRMQNHTDSKAMRVWWSTDVAPEWTADRSRAFAVNPSETGDTLYRVPLGEVGRIRRLRLDFSSEAAAVTGTCRIDYICLVK